MARVSIDDDVESRPEFKRLSRLLNHDDDKALGMLVRFLRLAQEYWGQGKLVPMDEIENWELQPIIESRWGIVRPEGVYAIKSEEQFAWYLQKVQAGRKRSDSDRNSQGQFTSGLPAAHQRLTSGLPAAYQPLAPAPAPALVNINTEEERTKGEVQEIAPVLEMNLPTKKKTPSAPSVQTDVSQFIGTYVKAFQNRYGEKNRPYLGGKVQGQIKYLLQGIPVSQACSLVQVYLQMDGKRDWFKTKGHDLTTFIENLNLITVTMGDGKESGNNKTDWDDFERKVKAGLI